MRHATAIALLAWLPPAAAAAQSAQRPPDPPPGAAAEVTVRARPSAGPAVVSTYPAQGAVVAAGTLVLTVTFNQEMTPAGWSYAKAAGLDFPTCLKTPRLLPDKRTFVLLCATRQGRSYGVGLDADPAEGFADAFHRFAPRVDLRFSTDPHEEPVRALADALSAAGLKPSDDPIDDWIGAAPAGGTAQAPPPRGP